MTARNFASGLLENQAPQQFMSESNAILNLG